MPYMRPLGGYQLALRGKRKSTPASQPNATAESTIVRKEFQNDNQLQTRPPDAASSDAGPDDQADFCAECRAIDWDVLLPNPVFTSNW
ncbi:hypothetical protein ACEPPN_013201 [Leptodophora sp. 'Broadleaf-Isolate-01']